MNALPRFTQTKPGQEVQKKNVCGFVPTFFKKQREPWPDALHFYLPLSPAFALD